MLLLQHLCKAALDLVVRGLGASIAEGMAFETGSAVAHRAVDSVLGPRTIIHETIASAPEPTIGNVGGAYACSNHFKAFQDCLNYNGSDISRCQFYIYMLNECRRTPGSVLNA